MNWKKTLFLAVLLGTVIFFIREYELPRQKADAQQERPFQEYVPSAFSRLDITLPEKEVVSIVRAGSEKDWQFADLAYAKLDTTKITAIISAIQGIELTQKVPPESLADDQSVYGLKTPLMELSFEVGGDVRRLQLGKMNEFVEKRYVSWNGDVYLIADTLYTAANHPRDEFRSRDVIWFPDGNIESVKLLQKQERIVLARNESADWSIIEPFQAQASQEKAQGILRAVRGLQIEKFFDDGNPEEYGLENPDFALELRFTEESGHEDVTLSFAESELDKGKAYLHRSDKPVVYLLQTNPIPDIALPLNDYREKRPFRFSLRDVRSFRFEVRGEEKFQLKKDGEDWMLGEQVADTPFVEEFLQNLSQVQAVGFPMKEGGFGFERPRASVFLTLSNGEGEQEEQLAFFIGGEADQGKGWYARRGDVLEPFIITDDSLKKLLVEKESFIPVSEDTESAGSEEEPPRSEKPEAHS